VEDLSTSIDFKTELQSELQAELQSSSIGAQPSVVQNLSSEFATRIGAKETLFEPPSEATTALASPQPPSPMHSPTEVISAVQVRELGKLLESEPKPMAEPTPVPVQHAPAPVQQAPAPVQQAPAPVQQAPAPVQQAPAPVQQEPVPVQPKPAQDQQISASKVDQVEIDRRTIVVAEQASLGPGERGKIVGWLITYSRNEDGQDFRIYEGYNRIGANQVCDIVIEDETVSGSHAIIVYREDRCLIKDDLSRNGTFVNGREITEAYPLQNYDQIRVGNTHLTYVSAQRAS
jgi:hypothetical protein